MSSGSNACGWCGLQRRQEVWTRLAKDLRREADANLQAARAASPLLEGRFEEAERIIERLQELQVRYPGLEEVHVGQVVGTDERVILEQLEWFARDVMPVFKPVPSFA